MSKEKIKKKARLLRIIRRLKSKGRRVVFTNGCFDILHAGHVHYLEHARKLGSHLVVALNSDCSVRQIKGKDRPVNRERDRAAVLAGLESVDFVTIFNERTPLNLIKAVKPDVLVKGADWRQGEIIGAKEVLSWGGKVRRIALLKGRSTSRTIRRFRGKTD